MLSGVTVTNTHRDALENQFGLADRIVDEQSLRQQRRALPPAGHHAANVRRAGRPVDV